MEASQLYEKLKSIKLGGSTQRFMMEMCEERLPVINRIEALKKEKNAIVLAHNYVSPYIFYGAADHTGDSYGLAKVAQKSNAEIIVFAAVRFMAETAKLVNPTKTVLDPNFNGGCSLADGITGDDVRRLRKQFPDHTFVCYINTTAEVKALCDVCVTSSNVNLILERIENDKIYFLPDKLMGENATNFLRNKGVNKQIEVFNGTCYVHEEYRPESIDLVRQNFPDAEILAHPECKPSVADKADYVGSTTGMLDRVRESDKTDFFLLTECGLTDVLQSEFPDKRFVGTCTQCQYMKSNSLEDIVQVLENPRPDQIVELDPEVLKNASYCVEQMFHYAQATPAGNRTIKRPFL